MKKKYLYPLFMTVGFMVCSHTEDASPTTVPKIEHTRSQLKDIGAIALSARADSNDIIRPSVPYRYVITEQNDTLALVDHQLFKEAYGQEFVEKNKLGTARQMIGEKRKTIFDVRKSREILTQFKDNNQNEHEFYAFSESRVDFRPYPELTADYDVIRYNKELCGPIETSFAEAFAKSGRSKQNPPYLALKSD